MHTKPTPLKLLHARSFKSRLIGLLGTKYLEPNTGLCIYKCNFIHSFGMKYSIDVVFLDGTLNQTKCIKKLKPWRIAYCAKAKITVELNAGFCKSNPDYLKQIQSALLLESLL